MKRFVLILSACMLIFVCLCLCFGGEKEAENDYTFGRVGHKAGADGSGYKKAMDELYGVVGKTRNMAFTRYSEGKIHAVHVWNTADGGMVACDSKGNYVYTPDEINDNQLASVLVSHFND